ncbi:magnesium-translocating P-type ATPase [Piscinibacter gummiphilus]|uniref:Magnesium-transporting ATPase, P-type 1 n=1 Tax=Piscinibacter gummiphilus TaxID=946333 RepID=A0ABZ0D4Z9_9BURK|nr:magnesium-translocating P-type ATPase [Piscinibacter gummiphilus]WOB10601.1 magnesium-translocating P-type ATPase [Piscinibacter gummiphilus]
MHPHANPSAPSTANRPDWSLPADELLQRHASRRSGLGSAEARARLQQHGPNAIDERTSVAIWRLALRQVSSPLVLILVIGGAISALLTSWADAATILAIVTGSAALGFWQELRASQAVESLRKRLALTARTWRDGTPTRLPARELVAGDVVELSAGNLVPADGVVLEARDFLVTEASLTGETFPVEKHAGPLAAGAALRERTNSVFLGSSVRSGSATVLITQTGERTVLGELASGLRLREPETRFALGTRRFGEMLLRVMFVVVIAVLAMNQWLGRPLIDSLLFAVALAVGLSPELLPAIVSVMLARGTRKLAAQGVLVRRLEAIEDLGGMNVLCTDKTGTLTQGEMTLDAAVDPQGQPSPQVLQWAYLNAAFETGIENPLDAALVRAGETHSLGTAGWRKVDEIPYDFVRKRLTIVACDERDGTRWMVVKGAVAQVLDCCSHVAAADGPVALDGAWRTRLDGFVQAQGESGLRVLALATRHIEQDKVTPADEQGLTLQGFLSFSDPPKPSATQALQQLRRHGVRVKMITGDNRHVAAHVAQQVGLDPKAMLTGEAIAGLRDESLWHLAPRTDLFVEVDPSQKERIVRALQRTRHAVGFLGDGINDAPALHAADVGISVDQAVDVARESADIVLLQPDLGVLCRGVEEGRRTFANTLKYISLTISANFGNMVSMALATPFLPFLPLTATQILLNNFLSDLPAMALSTDRVEASQLRRPRAWKMASLRRFMLVFGLTSSVFDLITFAVLLWVLAADEAVFRTAWFQVSLLTELAVVVVLRSREPAWTSPPAPMLSGALLAVALVALALPYTGPLAAWLGFVPLPLGVSAAVAGIVVAYAASTELVKRFGLAKVPP